MIHTDTIVATPPVEQAPESEPAPGFLDDASRQVLEAMGPAGFIPELLYPAMRSLETDEYGYDQVFLNRYYLPIFDFFYDKYFRVSVEGAEHLPADGSALFVVNHAGCLPWDYLMLKLAILRNSPGNRLLRGLGERFVSTLPFVSMIASRTGEVLACQENGLRLLDQGEYVGVFPEGVKGIGKYLWQRYQLERFGRGGFVSLALEARAPIIPVCVFGSEETNPILFKPTMLKRLTGWPFFPGTLQLSLFGPPGLLMPIPSKITIRFLEPITFAPEDCDFILESDARVMNLAEEVRTLMQHNLDQMFRRRKNWITG